ncbi:MAG: chromate resistance protein [Alphaproteobacteria bacterium]|nr:chromate resistance protein [Alphaproteobacteria bacterium]MBV9693292.1 chromate resistance protein [Alphaproteobacteria bacterium]
MSAINCIDIEKLQRLVGTHRCPALIDLRASADLLVPSSRPRSAAQLQGWAKELDSKNAVVICDDGRSESPGVAAWLRQRGVEAEVLEGGFAAWRQAGLPLVSEAALPKRDALGRTRWVTRERPKVDRIACPWLIRRFVDPDAVFLFVAPGDVPRVAAQLDAAAFDVEGEGVVWSHDGERCTFDVMVDGLGLSGFPALKRLALIVRGADTSRLDTAPEAAGLLAASLGLSRMYTDDHAQLDAGMALYDAFYRWCRDASAETHNWTSHKPKAKR